ncbi:MAG: hypothetical protein B7Z73_13840 [Planctomycetia bacterium 21-64-5]|nr:MAG: hypothetical protein B7Z73_13840 [Planctomycetia bacterium 21-64-5]
MILGALGTERLTPEHLAAAMRFSPHIIGWGDGGPALASSLVPPYNDHHVTAEHIELVHSHGLKAWVWTVDEPARARELIDWQVDGLITNVPGAIKPIVEGRRQQAELRP